MKTFLSIIIMLVGLNSFAQSDKYVKAMEPLVEAVDTTHTRDALVSIGNSFERIAEAEKTQWLPYYYAALANINAAYTFAMDGGFGDKSADIDPIADKAEKFIKKAEGLTKDNSEIWVVKKMLASVRLMGNPMSRYQEYGPLAAAALETAKKLNPENPRVYLLEGQDLYFTPEQFGGNKDEAKKKFKVALSKFETAKPASSIDPHWGLNDANYFLSLAK